ncbi:DUF6527 family protein [Nocardioides marmoraquaticus]
MTPRESYTHEIVEFIPETLQPGVLYVSFVYATAAHRCMCGCGYEVNTPLSPAQWRLSYDGRSMSICPSIGNWSFECESHYWLEGGSVEWAGRWSREKVAVGRANRRRSMQRLYGELPPDEPSTPRPKEGRRPWGRLTKLFSRR